MQYRHSFIGILLGLIFLTLITTEALVAQSPTEPNWYKGGPWETELFTTDPELVRRAADQSHNSQTLPVTIFFNAGQGTFRDDGSLEQRSVLVYRIDSADGLQNWADTDISWSPWHQEPPQLRVRIISPDGTVSVITEKNLMEVSPSQGDGNLYSDQKRLKAPYPNVALGSIIEEELITVTKPYLPGTGAEVEWYFSRKIPVGLNRLALKYPQKLAVQIQVTNLDQLRSTPVLTDGMVNQVWELHHQPARQDLEDYTPPDNRQLPVVVASSAPAWSVLAEKYSQAIENVIQSKAWVAPSDLSLPRNNSRQAVLLASRWINTKVRYTGLELGQNSIIPFSPSEVVARGYGDCKDKATLLVTLLRSAGYHAWVSLLRTGPGWDITPQPTGITSFNHAIVYIDEEDGYWFDPTIEITPSTDLPYQDQFRYTLIARPGQNELRQTPQLTASKNRVLETREFFMKDEGKGSVRETTIYGGSYETYYRNYQLYRNQKESQDHLKNYANEYYKTQKVVETTWSAPRDLALPIQVTLAADDISRATTGDIDAIATLHLNNLRNLFPDFIVDEKTPKRTQPFRFNLAFSYQLTTKIHPPAGFKLRDLPKAIDRQTAAFHFQQTWEQQTTGLIVGVTDFEITQIQLSSDELLKLHQDLQTLFKDGYEQSLIFDHRGETLRAEGRYAEAFQCYREILQANPQSAIQNKRLSNALLSYSLGQPALFYAQKAAELNPENPSIWANLANILMYDGLGRRLNKGYDRPHALEAWKKALELDPNNSSYLVNLAILYEFNSDGNRYESLEDLKRARDAYMQARSALKEYELAFNLWIDDIRLGDLAAARLVIPDITDNYQRNLALVVTALLQGSKTPPMKLLEPNLSLDKRQSYLIGAADNLVSLRRYSEAASLLRLAAVANKEAASIENRADALDRVRAIDAVDASVYDPIVAAKQFLFAYLQAKEDRQSILRQFGSQALQASLDRDSQSKLTQDFDVQITRLLGTGSRFLLTDVALSLLAFESSGDEQSGYRLTVGFEGDANTILQLFFVRENGSYRLVSWPPRYTTLARQILLWLDQGNTDAAARWYDWIFPSSEGQNLQAFDVGFFRDSRLPRNPWLMRQVAQMMVLADFPGKDQEKTIAGLFQALRDPQQFYAQAQNQQIPSDAQEALWTTLVFSLADSATVSGLFESAAPITELLNQHTGSNPRFRQWFSFNLALRGQGQRAEALAEDLFKAKPDDRDVFINLFNIYLFDLNFPKLDELATKYPSRLGAMELNNLAWAELFREPLKPLSAVAVERARKAVNLSQSKEKATLHTLATVYATMGRYDEARSVLSKVIELNPGNEPSADDWYVIGLMAEGYGFHDAAVDAWKKVTRPADRLPEKVDTVELAKIRLQ